MGLFEKIFGTHSDKEIKRILNKVNQIEDLEPNTYYNVKVNIKRKSKGLWASQNISFTTLDYAKILEINDMDIESSQTITYKVNPNIEGTVKFEAYCTTTYGQEKIFETDLLNKTEIIKACEICIEAGADFVKTSTGFVKNGVGAKEEDVRLMFETVKNFGLGVKASGGIRDRETALKMIDAGAVRLGTSSGVKICTGE